jgi:hypothetical protein
LSLHITFSVARREPSSRRLLLMHK